MTREHMQITPEMRHEGLHQTTEQIGRVANMLATRTIESPQAVASYQFPEGEKKMDGELGDGVSYSALRDKVDGNPFTIMRNIDDLKVNVSGEDGNDYSVEVAYDKPTAEHSLSERTNPVDHVVIKQQNRDSGRRVTVRSTNNDDGVVPGKNLAVDLSEKEKSVGHSSDVRAARKAAAKVAWNMRNELAARKRRQTDSFIEKLDQF